MRIHFVPDDSEVQRDRTPSPSSYGETRESQMEDACTIPHPQLFFSQPDLCFAVDGNCNSKFSDKGSIPLQEREHSCVTSFNINIYTNHCISNRGKQATSVHINYVLGRPRQ